MDRSLTNEEIDKYQFELRDLVAKELNCELRWTLQILKAPQPHLF